MVKWSIAHFPINFARPITKHPASGNIVFSSQPATSATITLNGSVVTFVVSGASGNQINIGGSLAATLQNAVGVLNTSADAQIKKCSYSANATTLFISHTVIDSTANSYTLARSTAPASNATVSAATLLGG